MDPKTTYDEQRKNRLDEVVFDYIQDEKVTPENFMKNCKRYFSNNNKYFQEQAMRIDRML